MALGKSIVKLMFVILCPWANRLDETGLWKSSYWIICYFCLPQPDQKKLSYISIDYVSSNIVSFYVLYDF